MTAKDLMPIRLHLPNVRVNKVLIDEPHRLEVSVSRIGASVRCRACGHKTRQVHQTTRSKVRDLPVQGRPTTLVFAKRRFICVCGTTTTEELAGVEKKLTLRLRRHLIQEVVDSTVAATARRHGLHWHQVMAVVLTTAAILRLQRRRQVVRILCVDEKSLQKGMGGQENFSTVLSDGETGKVIAVLEGRSNAVLAKFLAGQSREWRCKVRVVCTDMATCYRAAIRCHLPKAIHVVDRFHVTRNFLRVLQAARREAQRTKAGEPHDPLVFKARFAMLTRIDRLSPDQATQLLQVFAEHPELEAIWEMTQRFHRIYEADGLSEALVAIEEFCEAWNRTNAELGSAVKTLLAWDSEWLAFHTAGRATSGVAEGVNNKIEVLERKAYGFSCRANHHARILLECAGHNRIPRAI